MNSNFSTDQVDYDQRISMIYAISMGSRVRSTSLVSCFLLLFIGLSTSAQTENLIRVKDKNGRDSSLLEKVVVVSDKASISKSSNSPGEFVEAWSIFFRIKNEDGTTHAVNERLRVGDALGNHVGWIEEKNLRKWSTRFILDPIEPQPQRKFVINVEGGGRAEQQATPEGKKRFALISDNPNAEKGDDTEYPVIVYAGNVQGVGDAGSLAKQKNALDSVGLDMIFVVETNDFMDAKFGTPSSILDQVKLGIGETIEKLRNNEKINKAVRFGLVEYKDSDGESEFVSRLSSDLTNNFDIFLQKVNGIQTRKVEQADWAADVLSGIDKAVNSASWSENSVKHIVLLGIGSCQLAPKGTYIPLTGRNSPLDQYCAQKRIFKQGYNSTNLSISQLISRARPQGGSSSKARSSKILHGLHFSHDIMADLKSKLTQEALEGLEGLSQTIDTLSIDTLGRLDNDTVDIILLVYVLKAYDYMREKALSEFREISQNNGEADGIFKSVEPNENARKEAITSLAAKVEETFNILEKVRDMPEGGSASSEFKTDNEFAQPLFNLVGAAAEKFKNQNVISGTAATRDERGREVAFKKVMVSEAELKRLRSTLDALFTSFKGKSSKSDRQDVGQILENMKAIVASTTAGQEVTANAKLKELISDLPLRSAALDTSAADLALMTTEAFTEWLERIESAVFRIDDLLKSQQDWLVLSDKAVNDKFTFLKLSELP